MNSKNNVINKNNTAIDSTSSQFITLFEADRRRIYAYIYAYVMDRAVADDIFQETSMILWREFEHFELGTNFSKWANSIVFNRVRIYRRNHKQLTTGLSESLMNEITETNALDDEAELRWQALQSCRRQLTDSDQQLYNTFYVQNLKAQQVAEQTGRSIYAIRKSVQKLRKKLFDCIDRKKREGIV